MKRVLLVRHGECHMNLTVNRLVGGQSNESPLTDRGRKQALLLGRHLAAWGPPVAAAWASPAVRARDTAQLVLQQLQEQPAAAPAAVPLVIEPNLLELSQGEWEGQPREQCYTPEVLAAIAADPWNFAPPGGDSQRQVEQRVVEVVEQQVLPALTPGGPAALVVAHGMAIKCFLRHILDSDARHSWKIGCANTSITEVGWVEGGLQAGWCLLRLNDTAHLQQQAAGEGQPLQPT